MLIMNDGIMLAKKGLFCFDAVIDDAAHSGEYIKIISPKEPLIYTDLPEEIKSILKKHIVNVDICELTYLHIEHAY